MGELVQSQKGKPSDFIPMYLVKVESCFMSYNIEATLPLLAVATMPQLNWKPEEFASVAKMEPGQVYRRKSYVGLELQVEIERLY